MDSVLRPRPSAEVQAHWHSLILAWANSDELPLLVRKFNANRGSEVRHSSGRTIVPVDNSSAHWALANALEGARPSLAEIRSSLDRDEIPVALAFRSGERERARYKCTRHAVSLNRLGWKVCHIDDVGFGGRIDVSSAPIARVKDHFVRYLNPANMFVVPLIWSGIGEMPEMIEAARRAVKGANASDA